MPGFLAGNTKGGEQNACRNRHPKKNSGRSGIQIFHNRWNYLAFRDFAPPIASSSA